MGVVYQTVVNREWKKGEQMLQVGYQTSVGGVLSRAEQTKDQIF